jgi:trans-aconitate 2-methyltransferase
MPTWDPQLYLRFASERTQPAADLLNRIRLEHPARMIDVGCGPGNSTAMLRQRWPEATIIGLDNSPEMLAAAKQTYPAEQWLLADAGSWQADRPFDLVFSNAALQWLPNHETLFPQLLAQVAPAGALAVQIPAHYASPLHMVVHEVAQSPTWQHLMDRPRQALTHRQPAFYYQVLRPHAAQIDIWETEYYHVVESAEQIVAWFRGTGLRPFLEALESDSHRLEFEQQVLEGYVQAYPSQPDGRILFPFRRLFVIAYHA